MANVSTLIKEIGNAPISERIQRLEELERVTRDVNLNVEIDDSDMLVVASFLNDENLESVHFSAMVLGNLGKRAIVAIPLLERNMVRLDAEEDQLLIRPAQPFATQIYVALSKIDGRPIPRGMGLPFREGDGSERR
jgi:hypothetical protein